MSKINYDELSKKLFEIVEYDYVHGRPIEICEELMLKYGRYYTGTVYHGAGGMTENEVLENYYGLISCSYDKHIAESFAVSAFNDNDLDRGSLFKIKMDRTFALDVQLLIEDCYRHCDNELCEYMYSAYNGENEMLLYFEDIQDSIEFINIKDE